MNSLFCCNPLLSLAPVCQFEGASREFVVHTRDVGQQLTLSVGGQDVQFYGDIWGDFGILRFVCARYAVCVRMHG